MTAESPSVEDLLAETRDKYQEAHYFIERMMHEYHNPQPFRWSLNAFLQALRSVTFILQKDLSDYSGFKDWYVAEQQPSMKKEELLRRFLEGRNLVVKERNLEVNSTAQIGLYRYRKPKLWVAMNVSPHLPSAFILRETAPKLRLIDEEHAAIGEEYGVKRAWHAPELGDGNVVSLCDEAWVKIGSVVSAAHAFIGLEWNSPPPHGHDPGVVDLLTETDVDPTLVEKWGWD